MNGTCVVVADARRARFYGVEAVESPRLKMELVERTELAGASDLKTPGESEAGPVHPMGEQRERHGVELERRFAQEIARQTGEIARGWKVGTVVLVAEPRLLGLMREPLRKALHRGIELKELARDYTHLTPAELYDHLALNSIVPVRRD
ncbi:MAG: host attachment protein [Betaproteobacteria bacterium]|nr:host attachment protein [Betaproteobacteria bacterium]MBI2509315.1 host attachment protein [Betaproteobacteria bacterium]